MWKKVHIQILSTMQTQIDTVDSLGIPISLKETETSYYMELALEQIKR